MDRDERSEIGLLLPQRQCAAVHLYLAGYLLICDFISGYQDGRSLMFPTQFHGGTVS